MARLCTQTHSEGGFGALDRIDIFLHDASCAVTTDLSDPVLMRLEKLR